TATFTVTDSTGQTVYTKTTTVQPGSQKFTWDGMDSNSHQLPDGNYTLTITAKDANNQSVAIPTQIVGVVDSVDLTQNPPMLSIGGQNYSVNQILKVNKSTN